MKARMAVEHLAGEPVCHFEKPGLEGLLVLNDKIQRNCDNLAIVYANQRLVYQPVNRLSASAPEPVPSVRSAQGRRRRATRIQALWSGIHNRTASDVLRNIDKGLQLCTLRLRQRQRCCEERRAGDHRVRTVHFPCPAIEVFQQTRRPAAHHHRSAGTTGALLCRMCRIRLWASGPGFLPDAELFQTVVCTRTHGGRRKSAKESKRLCGLFIASVSRGRICMNSPPTMYEGPLSVFTARRHISRDHSRMVLLMPEMQGSITGERARQLARHGTFSSRASRFQRWWPEETCESIERIVWVVSTIGDDDECWQEFTAYDATGKVLGRHRIEGY
jgi:hypothetical protein